MITDSGTRCANFTRRLMNSCKPSAALGLLQGISRLAVALVRIRLVARASGLWRSSAGWVGTNAAVLEHGELEAQLQRVGRELLRTLLQDHLALRACREQRVAMVLGSSGDGSSRAVERGHERRSYRASSGRSRSAGWRTGRAGRRTSISRTAALNLPEERASHGVRRVAASECPGGSFDDALASVRERTGVSLGKQQAAPPRGAGRGRFRRVLRGSRAPCRRRGRRARERGRRGWGRGEEAQGAGALRRREGDRDAPRSAARRRQPRQPPARHRSSRRACPRARKRIASGSRRSAPCTRSRPPHVPQPKCSPRPPRRYRPAAEGEGQVAEREHRRGRRTR